MILEEVKMSLGMEMQLSAIQSIFKYTLSNENEFFAKLYEAKFLSECLGKPDLSIVVSHLSEYDKVDNLLEESELKRESFSDSRFIHGNMDQKENINNQ